MSDIERYVDHLFGQASGYACLGFLRGETMSHTYYCWPEERARLVSDVGREIATGEAVDIYVCPHLRASKHRAKGDAASLRFLHVDLDGPPKSEALWNALEPFVVDSGTSDHRHGYIALDRDVDLQEWSVLQRAVVSAVGADTKISDNDLLRLPGTSNHKHDPPTAVTIASDGGTVWSPDELVSLLGVDPAAAPAQAVATGPMPEPEPLPGSWPAEVSAAFANQHTPTKSDRSLDRSEAIARLVGSCKRSGLTAGQAVSVVGEYPPAAEKFGTNAHRLAADVRRVWDKEADTDIGKAELASNKNNGGVASADPERFFSKADGLRVQDLVSAVDDLGSLTTDHAGQIYRYTDGAWFADGERVVNQRIQRLLANRHRKSHAVNVLDIIQSRDPLFTEDQLDVDHLNLPNGLLCWRTGELKPHDPGVPNLARLPVAWKPDATCPAVDQWLAEVFPQDAIAFVEEVIGYCLLNDNPMHKAIMLFGTGRNGKGIFVRLLEALVGRSNRSTVRPQQLDDNRFHAAELYGKLANLVGDVDPRIFKATEIFKQVTGGDTVTAERKYGHPFTFRCRATLVAAFNEMPRTADTSEGFFSRWIVVPFLVYFSDDAADKSLFARLSTPAELEGLLARAVAGLRRLMARGHFEEPECVRQATAGFRVAADPVRSFLDERATPIAGTFAHTSVIYGRFKEWCQENGHRPLSLKKFLGRVEAVAVEVLGVPLTRVKRNGHWGYADITVSDGDGGFGDMPGNLGKERASSLSLDPAYGGKGGVPSLASPTSPRLDVVSLYCDRCGIGGDPNTRLVDGANTCSTCAGET